MQGDFPVHTPLLRGALFAATGLGAVFLGAGYGIGAATAMGPGYFPVLAGGLLAAMGAVDVVRGLRASAESFPGLHLWPRMALMAGRIAAGIIGSELTDRRCLPPTL